jgi:hypothetical protein
MSVAGYLSAGKPELRMAKKCGDKVGVRYEGIVVTGEKTVSEQLRADAVRQKMSGEEYYESVEDYDPVLRSHCRTSPEHE